VANIAPGHVVAEERTEGVEVMRRECLADLLSERQIAANSLGHPKIVPPTVGSSVATSMISVAVLRS
jgi:hypothetical protein